MGKVDRAIGLARSLFIYHAIPMRQRRLTRLYSTFVRSGDIAFDVGAHAGNRTRALIGLGCHVVAVEPQASLARLLRRLFGNSRRVTILEAVVASREGRQTLWVSERHPTVATTAADWRDERSRESGFGHVSWDTAVDVTATTLDAMIETFGKPAFIKIDVEGAEPAVLAGLSRAVPALSFEYLPGALQQVQDCIVRLEQLAQYEYNWSPGETFRLASDRWLDASHLLAGLRSTSVQKRSGDVYARLAERVST